MSKVTLRDLLLANGSTLGSEAISNPLGDDTAQLVGGLKAPSSLGFSNNSPQLSPESSNTPCSSELDTTTSTVKRHDCCDGPRNSAAGATCRGTGEVVSDPRGEEGAKPLDDRKRQEAKEAKKYTSKTVPFMDKRESKPIFQQYPEDSKKSRDSKSVPGTRQEARESALRESQTHQRKKISIQHQWQHKLSHALATKKTERCSRKKRGCQIQEVS
jgi:hypothetical protein